MLITTFGLKLLFKPKLASLTKSNTVIDSSGHNPEHSHYSIQLYRRNLMHFFQSNVKIKISVMDLI